MYKPLVYMCVNLGYSKVHGTTAVWVARSVIASTMMRTPGSRPWRTPVPEDRLGLGVDVEDDRGPKLTYDIHLSANSGFSTQSGSL